MIKLLAAAFLSKALLTSFEYRNSSPLSLFPGSQPAAEAEEPLASGNPAYLPLFRYSYVSSSASNPYTMEDMYHGSISAGTGFSRLGVQAAWSRFGTDFYSENILEMKAGFMPVTFLSAGLGYTYYMLDISTEDVSFSTAVSDFSASLLLMPAKWLFISCQQENIHSLYDRGRSDLLFPESAGGIMLKPAGGLSFSWNLARTAFGYVNSFSISASILSFFRVKGGYSRETCSYSAALSVKFRHYSLSYGLRYHSYLRATHSIGITISTSTVPYEGMNYLTLEKKKSIRRIKKIDIRTGTFESLRELPCLSDTISRRIIKYREMIGPVTEKSLIQVGMSLEDVNQLKSYVYGLADEKDKRKKYERKNWKVSHKQKRREKFNSRKRIFIKLLETGIGATASLRLSELSVSGNRKEISAYLESIPGLTPLNRKKIITICSK